ncbi:MAG TPA: DUF5672 family protein [Xanthobacteraceae bacterium]|nr:DUF5672 family protein [Xanthobacteraceae bacterium]
MPTRLHLPDVTLVAVTSLNIDKTNEALLHCASHINFGAVKFLCSENPSTLDQRIEYLPIPQIDYLGYSRFMIESLNSYIQTPHCLVVQYDGFVLDPSRWRDDFLAYDYVGAPWPKTILMRPGNVPLRLHNTVGNGGFSLRSKKLLEATSRFRFDQLSFPIKVEDILICHFLYKELQAAGIAFAPPGIAARFAIETELGYFGQSIDTVFGFHGKHWLSALPTRAKPVPSAG